MKYGPNPNAIYPNEAVKSVCFIKNVITRPNIIVGDYTYYDDINGAESFFLYMIVRGGSTSGSRSLTVSPLGFY